MNVLIVFVHPEPQSLNASLRDVAITKLQADGHNDRFQIFTARILDQKLG